MKSIRDFVEGKIRRTESADRMSISDGAPDAEFGANQGVVHGPNGTITFYENGLLFSGGGRVAYRSISRVTLATAFLDITLDDGSVQRLATSDIGGQIVHATLRWIGHTRLRRAIAD